MRLAFLVSRSLNLESSFNSGTPSISAKSSHCSCLFAAIFIYPSFVLNVPEGAAVKLSFPINTGCFPPINRFAATQPISGIIESSIATSMNCPSPERSLWYKAARIANAAFNPPTVSQTGNPARSGFNLSSPLIAITPLRPWIIWSYAGLNASGPV